MRTPTRARRPRAQPCLATALLLLAPVSCTRPAVDLSALQTGRLGQIRLLQPSGSPRALVFLFSSPAGWSAEDERTATAIGRNGAIVVGVDWAAYRRSLDASDGECLYLLSEIESLSQQVQRTAELSSYVSPILAGSGEAAALVSAALTQTPFATVAGVVAIDPEEAVRTRLPLCPGAPSRRTERGFVYAPVPALPGFWSIGFTAQADSAGRRHVEAAIASGMPGTVELARADETSGSLLARLTTQQVDAGARAGAGLGLPLVELRAGSTSDSLAIVLSGDGGWRDLDKTIAERLRDEGVNVVGWDSLRYFWKQRTAEDVARDLDTVIRTYSRLWNTRNVALIGYSFGADVLPFAYNRLPDDTRRSVAQISLLGFSHATDFVVHISAWIGAGASRDALSNVEETARVPAALVQCFYGREEEDTQCPDLEKSGVEVIATAGSHHFDGDYDRLARHILDGLRRRTSR